MEKLRISLPGGSIVGVAIIGLALVASAPAASSQASVSRPFFIHGHEQMVERSLAPSSTLWSTPSFLRRVLRIAQTTRRAGYVHMSHAVSSEAVDATLAAAWHAKGLTGRGVKVAIIDEGFAGLAERQSDGQLPADVVTQDFCRGNLLSAGNHGTAVAEIVHDMAPGAQLYLVCIEDADDFEAAVEYAKRRGVHVINHSAGWEGPFRNDGTDRFSQLVASARASGILWVNSAGNEGENHWTGTYRQTANLHVWSPNGDVGNTFVWPDGTEICGILKWDEWPAGVSDFDLGLFLSGTNVLVASSEEAQGTGGGEPPFEAVCVEQSSGEDLTAFWAIRGYSVRSNPRIDFVSWSPPLEYYVAEGSIAAPATSPASLAVGALCWQSRALEPYSSRGPTIDGRMKPDLVGHDSVSSSTYGSFEGCASGFAGTSASSPEVAGAAALVKQAFPALAADGIKDYLLRNARDHGAPGADSNYGAGELQLPTPPDVIAPSAVALTSTGRYGRTVMLRSRVEDDSGELRLIAQVRRNGRVLASLRRGYLKASRPMNASVAWNAPRNGSGSYQHCVRAFDRAGNASPQSCARIVLKAQRH